MAGSLEIARSLVRRPAVRATAVVLLAAGVAAGSLPLIEAPGYELGEAAALLAALLAPFVGIAAARLALATPRPSPLAAWGAASIVLGGLIALLLAAAVARAALGPCAALGRAAAFLPLLAGPTVLLGAALAVSVGFVAGGRRALAGALYALTAGASLAVSLRAAYLGTAAFVFDPLLGAWPGPIYDEALVPDLRVVILRAAAAGEALAVIAAAQAFVRGGRGGLGAARRPLAAALVLVLGVAGGHLALERLGLSGSRHAIARALGGHREGRRCSLVLPAEKPPAAAAALLAECEFQVADVARALGIEPPPRVVAFVYRSTEEKGRLVGAAATEYAKPWLGEVHVVDAPLPHPVLRHELVHAIAAGIAGGPLGVPARRVVLVSAGLVEGLAAALETPRGRFTVHEWSRAAKELGLLPDVADLVGPAGFYAQPPARAYTAAGSFLAFLLERYGAGPVREAYRTGDVSAAIGVPLPALAAEWERFLDGIEPPPGLLAAGRARLGRRSLFARRCAREVATLEARAASAAAAGRSSDACALYEAAAARSGSAATLKVAGDVRARAGDLGGAAEAYRAAAAGDPDGALRAALAASKGDLAWRRDELRAAVSAWSAALATHPERAEARLLEAKILAASDAELAAAARPLLLGDGDPGAALARLGRMPHPLAAYLTGRALALRGDAAAAIPALDRAARARLPPALAREAALLLAEARCAAGRARRGRGDAAGARGAARVRGGPGARGGGAPGLRLPRLANAPEPIDGGLGVLHPVPDEPPGDLHPAEGEHAEVAVPEQARGGRVDRDPHLQRRVSLEHEPEELDAELADVVAPEPGDARDRALRQGQREVGIPLRHVAQLGRSGLHREARGAACEREVHARAARERARRLARRRGALEELLQRVEARSGHAAESKQVRRARRARRGRAEGTERASARGSHAVARPPRRARRGGTPHD